MFSFLFGWPMTLVFAFSLVLLSLVTLYEVGIAGVQGAGTRVLERMALILGMAFKAAEKWGPVVANWLLQVFREAVDLIRQILWVLRPLLLATLLLTAVSGGISWEKGKVSLPAVTCGVTYAGTEAVSWWLRFPFTAGERSVERACGEAFPTTPPPTPPPRPRQ